MGGRERKKKEDEKGLAAHVTGGLPNIDPGRAGRSESHHGSWKALRGCERRYRAIHLRAVAASLAEARRKPRRSANGERDVGEGREEESTRWSEIVRDKARANG